MIDTNLDHASKISFYKTIVSMACKKGYIHNFAWFEIQSKRMCINCGMMEDK
jgi:hypothetical protein